MPVRDRESASHDADAADIARQIEELERITGWRCCVLEDHGHFVVVETFDPSEPTTGGMTMTIISRHVRERCMPR